MRPVPKPARVLLLVALALAGCSRDRQDPVKPALQGKAPDFAIQDVNPNSARAGTDVSPRQYLGKVSAWYFGHAT